MIRRLRDHYVWMGVYADQADVVVADAAGPNYSILGIEPLYNLFYSFNAPQDSYDGRPFWLLKRIFSSRPIVSIRQCD